MTLSGDIILIETVVGIIAFILVWVWLDSRRIRKEEEEIQKQIDKLKEKIKQSNGRGQ